MILLDTDIMPLWPTGHNDATKLPGAQIMGEGLCYRLLAIGSPLT